MDMIYEGKQDGRFLAVRDGLDLIYIRDILQQPALVFSDLDDTLAPSSAKRIVYKSLVDRLRTQPKELLSWLPHGAIAKFLSFYESEAWQRYVKIFLDESPQGKENLKVAIDLIKTDLMLFPGVETLYDQMHFNSRKVLVTRNVLDIATLYMHRLRFHHLRASSFNKKNKFFEMLDQYEKYHSPYINKPLVIVHGDSMEDEEIKYCADHEKQRGRVREVCFIQVAKSLRKVSGLADIVTSRDQRLLAANLI